MRNPLDIAPRLFAYLKHEVTEQESQEIEQELQQNPRLKNLEEQFHDKTFISQEVAHLQCYDIETALANVKAACYAKHIHLLYYKRWSAVAAIAASIVLAFILFPSKSPTPNPATTHNIQLVASNGNIIDIEHAETKLSENIKIRGEEIIVTAPDHSTSTTSEYYTLVVPRGKTYSIKLPDGTEIKANALSTIKFPYSFKGKRRREVELTGEAYFDVAHDAQHPFIVKSGDNIVTVKGTAFNLSNYEGEAFKATLCRGSILLQTGKGEEILMEPGQQVCVNIMGEANMAEVNTSNYTAWIDGKYFFDNQTLDEVVTTLSKWYDIEGVDFVDKSLENKLFSGKFNKTDHLSTIIKVLETGTNSKIIYQNHRLIIERK